MCKRESKEVVDSFVKLHPRIRKLTKLLYPRSFLTLNLFLMLFLLWTDDSMQNGKQWDAWVSDPRKMAHRGGVCLLVASLSSLPRWIPRSNTGWRSGTSRSSIWMSQKWPNLLHLGLAFARIWLSTKRRPPQKIQVEEDEFHYRFAQKWPTLFVFGGDRQGRWRVLPNACSCQRKGIFKAVSVERRTKVAANRCQEIQVKIVAWR